MPLALDQSMRPPVIGPEKRETIVAKMRRTGRYSGRVRGCRIILWRKMVYDAAAGGDQVRIGYQINRWGRRLCHGVAPTVIGACELIGAALGFDSKPAIPPQAAEETPEKSSVVPYSRLQLRYPERERFPDA